MRMAFLPQSVDSMVTVLSDTATCTEILTFSFFLYDLMVLRWFKFILSIAMDNFLSAI